MPNATYNLISVDNVILVKADEVEAKKEKNYKLMTRAEILSPEWYGTAKGKLGNGTAWWIVELKDGHIGGGGYNYSVVAYPKYDTYAHALMFRECKQIDYLQIK